ncbi:MAG TPA: hypothetical protein VGC76_13660 [Pyrinomonadaceae bacterium]|jgi:hypothetical protein
MAGCTGNACSWTLDPKTGKYNCIDSTDVNCSRSLFYFIQIDSPSDHVLDGALDRIIKAAEKILASIAPDGEGRVPSFINDPPTNEKVLLTWEKIENSELVFLEAVDKNLIQAAREIRLQTTNVLGELPLDEYGREPAFILKERNSAVKLAWVNHNGG